MPVRAVDDDRAYWVEMLRRIAMPVLTNMSQGTFDQNGWLQIGFSGHQPGFGEDYISTGSLYLCSVGFLPLGLRPDDPFWVTPPADWTSKKAWQGINDEDRLVQGELKLALQNSDSELSVTAGTAFAIPAFGAQTYELELPLSKSPGEYWLRASATETGKSQPTVSRRKVRLEPQ
jgi:hypothetical protein